ncbi:MAG: hypothetical protein ACRENP_05065 [Longimicrobiales bacterium]
MSRARVRLHIDTLAVHGLHGLSPQALADAVRQELQRSLGLHVDTLKAAPAHQERLDGGSFALRPAAGSREIGRKIGMAVQHGITPQ